MAEKRTIGTNPLDAMIPGDPASVGEAARRAARGGQAASRTATDAGSRVFHAWATGAEATLRATFEVQNAALEAGLSVLDAGASRGQRVAKQWADVAREAQEAAIEAFRESVRAAGEVARSTSSGGASER